MMVHLFALLAVLWVFCAWGAQINYDEQLVQGGIPPFGGYSIMATSCCEDAAANGSCDGNSAGATNSCSTHWTKPYNCRGKSYVSVTLNQATNVAGNTWGRVYNCHQGFVSTTSPASQPTYCADVGIRFGGGDLTDAAPDFSPQGWGGADLLVVLFGCTTNCEIARTTLTCF